ncbi:MAG: efflux RND transporter periplasmic adaptor subunit [Leptolyngbyaceae bacterium]|nr:efflux RND transporter periplasmic adaptor subunit [Leptolyngbyaceae bacterium]
MFNIKSSKSQFKTGIRFLIGSGAIALFAVGGAAWIWQNFFVSADAISVRVIEVERHTIEITINESGVVEFANQQTLTAPAEGAVEDIFVRPGDRVTAGQTLMTLRNPQRETALALQQVKIQQQEAVLERNRNRVLEAEEQRDAEQEELENLRELFEQGAIAQSEFQAQEDIVRQSISAVRDAELEVATAEADLATLRLEQQRIQQELKDTIISAPIDGIVLGVAVNAGDGIEIRTELLTIGDASQEWVELELSTLNASNVSVGQPVRVSVIGPDSQAYMGTVAGLYPQAISSGQDNSTPGSSNTGQPRVPTLIKLDTPSNTLIPGGIVNAEIILEQRPNVVSLNIEAIQQLESDPFVWMLDRQQQAQRRFIDIGLEGLTRVEILSGLEVGDEVILPPIDQPLREGDPLQIESEASLRSGDTPQG